MFPFFPDLVPPLRSCYDLQQAGHQDSLAYAIDTTGAGSIADAVSVYCWEGWTRILRRGQFKYKVGHNSDSI